ncbi:hypothetical protein BC830DRAFT_1171927 [Chytriomyces sp. MP71]|nr:hypothetical protein BC830DRAFT_1171927 [Chytriomyces sp. MP71]
MASEDERMDEDRRGRDRDPERERDAEGVTEREVARERNSDDGERPREERRFGKDRRSDSVKSLYVRGLAAGTRAEDLNSAFETYGQVRDVYIPKDYYSGGIKGFAYIQ